MCILCIYFVYKRAVVVLGVFVMLVVLEQEEFCFPVECLALTVQEVMHIRQVLVKAELEKFQQYKDVYNALKKGKVSVNVTFQSKKKL